MTHQPHPCEDATVKSVAATPPRADQCCINCAKPFVFGPKSDPRANVYTVDGKKEVAITQTCERCFDFMFEEMEDEE